LVERYGLWRLARAGFQRQGVDTSEGWVAVWVRQGDPAVPPVVMLHGASARGVYYRTLIEQLMPDLGTIVLPDLLGHGESELPRSRLHVSALTRGVKETLEALLDRPAVIYGNSLGGYIALKYAAQNPNRVLGVLVTSPAGGALPDALRRQITDQFLVEDWSGGRALVRRVLPSTHPVLHWILGYISSRQLRRPHMQALFKSIVKDDDLTPQDLANLPVHSCIIWGTLEQVLHSSQRDWFRASVPPHVCFEEPEGLGHSSYFEHTSVVADRLRVLLGELRDHSP
jgi:pimeloyl-ACP methyl ester carboxylesterase